MAQGKHGQGNLRRELFQVAKGFGKSIFIALPVRLTTTLFNDSGLHGPFDQKRFAEQGGALILDLLNDLGPVYGKAFQTFLQRSPKMLEGFGLERVYGDWPALAPAEIYDRLDEILPQWREHLDIEPYPLGVASMAQVHAAKSRDGRQWVVKLIKPKAKERMLQTLSAWQQLVDQTRKLVLTEAGRLALDQAQTLHDALRAEIDLSQEARVIQRAAAALKDKRSILKIPELKTELCSDEVLVLERFSGTKLSDILAGRIAISEVQRRALAKGLLHELLIQVFELGIFHADPHAGNLILMDDGSVGLFDWGLSGELGESERKDIAAMLRAVMALDLHRLSQVLRAMAQRSGKEISEAKIQKELQRLAKKLKTPGKGMASTIQDCLHTAGRLRIPLPPNLVLMAKALITIEGLATGIDPRVSLKFIAAPVLFKAARPGFQDWWNLAKSASRVVFQKNENQ
jgi:ubiquinone biosynthesis protein